MMKRKKKKKERNESHTPTSALHSDNRKWVHANAERPYQLLKGGNQFQCFQCYKNRNKVRNHGYCKVKNHSQKRHTNVNKSEKAVSSSKKKSLENIAIKQIEETQKRKSPRGDLFRNHQKR